MAGLLGQATADENSEYEKDKGPDPGLLWRDDILETYRQETEAGYEEEKDEHQELFPRAALPLLVVLPSRRIV